MQYTKLPGFVSFLDVFCLFSPQDPMNGLLNPDDYEKGQSPTQHDAFNDAFDAATEALRRPGIEQSLRAV